MTDRNMNNDSPLTPSDKDRLGFTEFAHNLADVFVRSDLSNGLIVGLEGGWGSGKSSVANIALHKLESAKDTIRVVKFAPWIVGGRLELIQELFCEFEAAADDLLPDDERDKTKHLLRQYARMAPGLAAAADLAAILDARAGLLAKILRITGKHASTLATPSLARLNSELRKKFDKLKHPVVVFIDDLDRLEPSEAVEVLRLIRAVADFPKVAYLLAYDPQHLATCLEEATGVKDGRAYLEKFVQASVTVPVPLGVDLKAWLTEDLDAIFDRSGMSPTGVERLNRATSCWCTEYVATPRDVVRVGNALRMYLAPVADKIDPADGLFVQILRIFRPELHDWVERHATARFAFDSNDSDAAWHVSEDVSIEDRKEELEGITTRKGQAFESFVHDLREHLPELHIGKNRLQPGFSFEDAQERSNSKRLWSMNHFRLYFSLAHPSGAISDTELRLFLGQVEKDPDKAKEYFLKLCNAPRPHGGNKAEVLLSRILEREDDILSGETVGLIKVLDRTADEFARQHERYRKPAGSPPSLGGDIVDVVRLVKRLDPETRMRALTASFAYSDSLWWASAILNKAALEHGFYGSAPRPVDQRFLTPEEFEQIRSAFLIRLNDMHGMHASTAKASPYLLSIMCVWHLAGGESEARDWVRSTTKSDGKFVELLELMKSRSNLTSGRKSIPNDYLDPGILEMFFESVDAVRERLQGLVSGEKVSADMRNGAQRLLDSISARRPEPRS